MKRLSQRSLRLLRRFWRETDGYVLSTELIVWLTLTICLLAVGTAAVRTAILHEFLDIAESLASREAGYEFSDDAEVDFFPSEAAFPDDLGTSVTRPTPVDASKEQQDLFPAGGGESN